MPILGTLVAVIYRKLWTQHLGHRSGFVYFGLAGGSLYCDSAQASPKANWNYQLDFTTPGSRPWWAISRSLLRQRPKSR